MEDTLEISLTPRLEIWRGLLLGQRSILTRLATELKRDFALTLPQYEALLALSESPNHTLPASALAQRLLYSSGSASNLFSKLEERGLIHRDARPTDGRVVMVTLTEAGADLSVRSSLAHMASIEAEFAPLIGDADIPTLLDFARRLAAAENVLSRPPAK